MARATGWYDFCLALLALDEPAARAALRGRVDAAECATRALQEIITLGATQMFTHRDLLEIARIARAHGAEIPPELAVLRFADAWPTVAEDADTLLLGAWLASECPNPTPAGNLVGCRLYDHATDRLMLDLDDVRRGWSVLRRAMRAGLVVETEWGTGSHGSATRLGNGGWQKRYAAAAEHRARLLTVMDEFRAAP